MNDINILSPGQRLREIRKILKIKQDELAGNKFSKNYISMFENNKRIINSINATYLARQINELAKVKGKNLYINASYLLKSNIDIARDKCEAWINEVESGSEMGSNSNNLSLYRTIQVASNYGLNEYKAKALYLKGMLSLRNEKYECSMAQLLGALVYYVEESDFINISDIYEKMGIILYNKGHLRQALVYFNLSYTTTKNNMIFDEQKAEGINYYIALCYYDMEQYNMAKKMLGLGDSRNIKYLELASMIDNALVV